MPPPSAQFRTVQGGNVFEVAVPQNWQAVSSTNAVKFVPQNGYGVVEGGESVFTHGIELGVARASSRNLADATRTLVANFARSNPDLRQTSEAQDIRLSQRSGLGLSLVNRSHLGGTERIGHLHDVAGGRESVLRGDDRARRRGRTIRPGVRSHRPIDQAARCEVGRKRPRGSRRIHW